VDLIIIISLNVNISTETYEVGPIKANISKLINNGVYCQFKQYFKYFVALQVRNKFYLTVVFELNFFYIKAMICNLSIFKEYHLNARVQF
jgi:hypothetical protein